jgi:hypothetical protein
MQKPEARRSKFISTFKPANVRHLRSGGHRRCKVDSMKLATGTVIGGKVVVHGEPLPEGLVLTVLARDGGETFEVSPELEVELLESLFEEDRGDTISADPVVKRLRRRK